jgi:predicted amidohydrolase YtcJ
MLTTPVTGSRPAPPSNVTPADIVVRNAEIFTGDPARPRASAVAITGGRITKVADDETIAPYVGESTQVIDAQGRRVVRGLNDSLLYVVGKGLKRIVTGCASGDPSTGASGTGGGSSS